MRRHREERRDLVQGKINMRRDCFSRVGDFTWRGIAMTEALDLLTAMPNLKLPRHREERRDLVQGKIKTGRDFFGSTGKAWD